MSHGKPQAEALHHLAAWLERAGLRVPVAMTLEMLRPLDFLSSQAVLFAHPFARGSRWECYTSALTHEQSWHDLRQLLDTPIPPAPQQHEAPCDNASTEH
jgi:hypothetical protein